MQRRLVRKQDVDRWLHKGWVKSDPQPKRAREIGQTVDLILMELKPKPAPKPKEKTVGKAKAKKKASSK